MAPVFVKRFYINKHIGMEGFYSFIIDDNVDEPNEKIIYGDGCRGYTPAKMNFNTKKFEYGSWADAFFMNVKPCMLNYGGTVAYYLDETEPLPAKAGRFDVLLKQPKVVSVQGYSFTFSLLSYL